MHKQILIVEDDPFIAAELRAVIEGYGYQVIGHADTQKDAISQITKLKPDLVCLDIDLGQGGSGLEVAQHLHKHMLSPFLFISSFFDEVTIGQARAFMPLGYIVKPFRDVDIKSNLSLAFHKIAHSKPAQNPIVKEDLFIRKDRDVVRVKPNTIVYIKGEDNYSKIFLEDGSKSMSSTTLKKIYDKIADYGFVRVHKSYVVNISRINGFNGTTLYVGAELIPIGRAYRADLMNRMTIL